MAPHLPESADAKMAEMAAAQGVVVSPEQRRASRFLENRGRRFLVDYGYGNVLDKATEAWRALRRKKKAGR